MGSFRKEYYYGMIVQVGGYYWYILGPAHFSLETDDFSLETDRNQHNCPRQRTKGVGGVVLSVSAVVVSSMMNLHKPETAEATD